MTRRQRIFILLPFVAIILLHHFFAYFGHFGFDDLHYARLAHDMTEGRYDFTDHFTFRTSILTLTAMSYQLFGITDFASALPSMLMTIATLILIAYIMRKEGCVDLAIALGLTTLSSWFLFYSDKIMPDIYVALSVISALAVLHQQRIVNSPSRNWLYAFLLVVTLFFGFISKGTIVLVLPVILFFFIQDMIKRRHISFWLYVLGFGVNFIAIYLIIIGSITGDIYRRFNAITENSYLNMCSYDAQTADILFDRISKDFILKFFSEGLGVGFIFIATAFLSSKFRRSIRSNSSLSFWVLSAVILILSANFMTISPTSYSPMCLDPRHYLFLTPVIAIPSAMILSEYVNNRSFSLSFMVGCGLMLILSYLQDWTILHQFWIPCTIWASLLTIKYRSRWFICISTIALVIILSLRPFDKVSFSRSIDYRSQKNIFHEQVLSIDKPTLIATNKVQKNLAEYYLGFDPQHPLQFVRYEDMQVDSSTGRPDLVYMNWHTRYLSGMNNNDLPTFVRYTTSHEVLFEKKELNIKFIRLIPSYFIPEQKTELFKSFNSFEGQVDNWSSIPTELLQREAYEGEFCQKIPNYSSTLEYPLRNTPLDSFEYLDIEVLSRFKIMEAGDLQVVISLESNGKAYNWQPKRALPKVKAYANWWPVEHNLRVRALDIEPESILKVYFWNASNQEAYIDNFEVSLIGVNKLAE